MQVQHLAVGIDGKAPASITGTLSDLVSKLESLGRATRQPPSPVRQQLVATVSPARPAGGLGSSLSGIHAIYGGADAAEDHIVDCQ